MILRCFVFTAIIVACLGCKCSNYIPQSAACHADIVVKAVVDGQSKFRPRPSEPWHHWYHLTTQQIFKRTMAAANLLGRENFSFNITELHGTSCSMDLQDHQAYLITGRIHEGQLDIHKCDWHLKWSELTTPQKLGFRHDYYSHC